MPADPKAGTRRPTALAASREEAVSRKVPDFGTNPTADDLESVRQVLGIARCNGFGVSYGPAVAMPMMARHPGMIRSAVLDSVCLPDPILPPRPGEVAAARDAFFASCGAGPAFDAAVPDLAGAYREAVERLSQAPPDCPSRTAWGAPVTAAR